MKRHFVLVVAVLALMSGVRAEEGEKAEKAAVIRASDKAALEAVMNKVATVEGTVSEAAWSTKGTVMIIRFEGAEESGFTAVVFKRERDAFDKAFDGDAAKALTGGKITVTGRVKAYRDKPEIILNKPSQVVVVEAKAGEKPADGAGTK